MSPALLFERSHAKPKHECHWQTCGQLFKKTQPHLNSIHIQFCLFASDVMLIGKHIYLFCGFHQHCGSKTFNMHGCNPWVLMPPAPVLRVLVPMSVILPHSLCHCISEPQGLRGEAFSFLFENFVQLIDLGCLLRFQRWLEICFP